MIKLKIDGKEFFFDKDEMEQKITSNGLQQLKENDFEGKRGMFSSLIGSALMMIGIKKPKEAKEMDNVEFASLYALHLVLSSLEGKTIELESSKGEVEVDN
jgi:hypothetical protein